tara:strand:- start:296 stop:865 length:570 start_codon:yes stop_codon:yes gene_type:complete
MKIPNIGLIIYYSVFIFIIPVILFLKSKMILKYYIPMIVVIAHLLSLVGDNKIFLNLYSLEHTTLTSQISTYIINIIALLGILWQIKDYTLKNKLFTGMFLLVIVFVLSRTLLKHILDYVSTKLDDEYRYNWPLLFVGLLYIIVLLVIQYAMNHISYKFIDERNNINKTQQFVKNFDLANINSFNNKLR